MLAASFRESLLSLFTTDGEALSGGLDLGEAEGSGLGLGNGGALLGGVELNMAV